MKNNTLRILLSSLMLLICSPLSLSWAESLFIVTNTNDSGLGSLRQAVLDANANSDISDIIFQIHGTGPHQIFLNDPLFITTPMNIKGLSQPGSACEKNLKIVLSNDRGSVFRFESVSEGSLQGVSIVNSDFGVDIKDSQNIKLSCNNIGVGPDGVTPGTNDFGIVIWGNSKNISVGEENNSGLNIITGNAEENVFIFNVAKGVQIRNNRIGMDANNTFSVPQERPTEPVESRTIDIKELERNLESSGTQKWTLENFSPTNDLPTAITLPQWFANILNNNNTEAVNWWRVTMCMWREMYYNDEDFVNAFFCCRTANF